MEIMIKLTDGEQAAILRMADEVASERGILTPWESLAVKIRRAQEDIWQHITPDDTGGCRNHLMEPVNGCRGCQVIEQIRREQK
jgi:hypothetical protein